MTIENGVDGTNGKPYEVSILPNTSLKELKRLVRIKNKQLFNKSIHLFR